MLVSDIGMPGEDGYALIRRVRALAADRGGQMPAAALTAYAKGEDAQPRARRRLPGAPAQAGGAAPSWPRWWPAWPGRHGPAPATSLADARPHLTVPR